MTRKSHIPFSSICIFEVLKMHKIWWNMYACMVPSWILNKILDLKNNGKFSNCKQTSKLNGGALLHKGISQQADLFVILRKLSKH